MMKTALAALAALVSSLAFCDTPGDRPEASVKLEDIRDFNTRVVTNAWMAVEPAVSAVVSESVSAATGAIRRVSGAARQLPKYLHALDFDDTYPDAAQEYYRSRGNGTVDGGCSAVRDGGFLYRNFDFPFDERAEFVVRMSAGEGRFASIGVAQVGTNLTEDIVTSGKPNRWYKALPGATVDGINENGVVCEINVVDTPVAGWHTTGDLHPLAAVRWVLDNATDAQSAAEYIAANVRFPAGWTQNFHYMVADETSTYIVENGVATNGDEYHEPDEPVAMTNFQLSKFPWDGMGMERFGLLLGGANITNAWYTRAYHRETNPPWVSDLAEVLAYTNDIFNAWASNPKEHFRGQLNGGKPWWQTVHTSIYDIKKRVLRVAVQETDDWYVFALAKNGTDEETVAAIANRAVETNGVTVALVAATNSLTAKVAAKADRATTLAGYGITDGATKAELESGLSATNSYLRKSGGTMSSYINMQGENHEDGEIAPGMVFRYRSGEIIGTLDGTGAVENGIRLSLYSGYAFSVHGGNIRLTGGSFYGGLRDIVISGTVSVGEGREYSLSNYGIVDAVQISPAQGIVDLTTFEGRDAVVFGSASRLTRIGGSSIDLFGGSTYVNGDLKPNRTVQMTPEQFRFTNRGNMDLIELIESYLHADSASGLSVTDPSYSFANQARTATLSAPHIPTEGNPVVTPQGTLTFDGTNYWLNGETQYNRDIAGDVKASVTLDRQMLTNVVTEVKSYHYDETLGVTWKMVPDDGHIYLIAVTNANVVAQ